MRFAPTEDQAEFREAVKSLLADTCTAADVRSAWGGAVGAHTEVGSGDGRIQPAWNGLAEMGVLGLLVPETYGGMGMTEDALVGIAIEAGWAGLPDPLIETAGVAVPLLASSESDLSGQVLGEIAAGESTVVVGFGDSPLVSNVATADWVILVGDEVATLVKADDVAATPLESVDGARHLARIDGLAAGAQTLEISRDVDVLGAAYDRAATFTAALLVGLSTRMLAMTVEYVVERKQFGVPIGSFQAVKHLLANAALDVEFAEPLAMNAAHLLSVGGTSPRDISVAASMAKSRASIAAQKASDTCLQCHGAIGYTVEHDLHLFMKRSWALSRQYGDHRQHRRRVREALLA